MKTYEQERHEWIDKIEYETCNNCDLSFLEKIGQSFDAGHARAQARIDEIQSSAMAYAKEAQARIKELEGDCQRKDALLNIAKESIDDSNKYLKLRLDEIQYLQTKLESCEKLKDDFAQLNHTLCHDLTVAKAENKRLEIDFQNNYRWRIAAVDKLNLSVPIADVKPLVEAAERRMKSDEACGHPYNEDMGLALQAFREKHSGVV